jgi:prevent-host-death family protein
LDFVTVRELHYQTPRVLNKVQKGHKAVITRRGKPAAILLPLGAEQIRDIEFTEPDFLKKAAAMGREAVKKLHKRSRAESSFNKQGPSRAQK